MKKHKDLSIATALLVVSLAINVGTVANVVNRPVEAIVVHKADNAVELQGDREIHDRETLHARLWGLREILSKQGAVRQRERWG